MSLLGERLDGPRVRLEADGPGEYRILRMLDGAELGRVALEEVASVRHRALTPDPSPAAAGEGSSFG